MYVKWNIKPLKDIFPNNSLVFFKRHTRVLETGKPESGPNMILLYPEEREVFADASDLLIHHVKRQASLSKREKISIKVELQIRYLIMHMFVRTTYLMATIPYCPISILTNLL